MSTPVAPSPPSVDVRWDLVQRIAASTAFHRSPRQRELLLYICERSLQNHPEQLREHLIGCGVFGRKADYNPGEDNIVRVEIRQLRKRLDDYFVNEGKDEPLVIHIPKGAYVPMFEPREQPAVVVVSQQAVPPKPATSHSWWFWPAVALMLLLLATCAWLWRDNREKDRRLAAMGRSVPERSAVWPLLFNNTEQTFVVCADSTLVVAEWILHRSIPLDEYLTNDPSASSSLLNDVTSLANSLAFSRQRWQFTDITDVRLVQRLYRLNADHWDKVTVRSARTAQIQDFKNGNTVLLGSNRSNLWNGLFEPMLNFRFVYDEQARSATIRNVSPRPGEQASYRAARPGETGDSYAIVALVPNLRHNGSVLMIAGSTAESTEAAGEFIMNSPTSTALLNGLMKRNKNRLPYFEVLLRSRTMAGIAKNAEIVADRILPDEIVHN
jgi:hypothetical protein